MGDLKNTEQAIKSLSQGKSDVVYTIIPGDLHTPVGILLRFQEYCKDHCFLFESVINGTSKGRFSVLAHSPDLILQLGRKVSTVKDDDGRVLSQTEDGLNALRELWATLPQQLPAELPSMAAGIFGCTSFEAVELLEPKLCFPEPDEQDFPLGVYIRPRQILIIDHVRDSLHIVQLVVPKTETDPHQLIDDAKQEIARSIKCLQRPLPDMPIKNNTAHGHVTPMSNMSAETFLDHVETCKKYIREGDVFQVVPSQRFSRPFSLGGIALYRALRTTNPSPYMFYVRAAGFELVGSSPEILVKVENNKVTLRPIAGTRKRGQNEEEDQALAEDLRNDPKECAEHLMLLDLGRNDVGRVSRIGTVKVEDEFIIERYSHVMHMVSQVTGVLNENSDAIDALLAGLPAGTVSGAPKIRALEIIAELEPTRRGIYAGGIGYLGVRGDMDTCLVLRTAQIRDGVMHVQAGAGIVYDSVPQSEFEETVNKARALFHAAEVAEERFGESHALTNAG